MLAGLCSYTAFDDYLAGNVELEPRRILGCPGRRLLTAAEDV
jgi:hypothetical protein